MAVKGVAERQGNTRMHQPALATIDHHIPHFTFLVNMITLGYFVRCRTKIALQADEVLQSFSIQSFLMDKLGGTEVISFTPPLSFLLISSRLSPFNRRTPEKQFI